MGWFEGQAVILVDGVILHMPPPNPPHDMATTLADYVLKATFTVGFTVRVQMGLVLGQTTDPVPDVAVVTGSPRDYVKHPTTAVLVVEVSDSTLAYDRHDKASLYAAAGILDYWVINLVDHQVEVHRQPQKDVSQPFGFGYADVRLYRPPDMIQPLAASAANISVADLLP
jgi:Uma2 family endonuclease